MNFYWVYDLPNWLFFLITIGVFVGFALLGAFLFSSKLEKKLALTADHNHIVAIFLGLSGAFYSITLGLIAAMDNPFRGEYSVTADSFQLLLDGFMK
jgi:quinol-cytochrome oxidoreductase complex cytochrome b subunit